MAGRFRWLPLACCCAVLVADLPSTAAENTAPASDDPIAAAKRDYERIKAGAAGTADQTTRPLVRQSLPPLESSTEIPAVVLSPIQRARKNEAANGKDGVANSKNWLVDALSPEKLTGTNRGERTNSLDDPAARGRSGSLIEEQRAAGSRARSEGNSARRSVDNDLPDKSALTGVSNPLVPYMSRWMTPGDFELLRSKQPNPGGTGSALPSSMENLPGSRTSSLVGPTQSADLSSSFNLNGLLPASKTENPYVTALPTVSPRIPPLTTAARPEAVSSGLMPLIQTVPSTVNEPAAAPKMKSPAGEKFNPQDDAKYFKQLKRF